MLVQVIDNGPAETLSPSVHETLASPTDRVAVPSLVSARARSLPRMLALAPSPSSFTVQLLPEQSTLSELQAAIGSSTISPAAVPAATRARRFSRRSISEG